MANKKRKSALSLFYLLNIVKIFVKIRFRVYDISFPRGKKFPSFVIPRLETRSFTEKPGRNVVFKISILEANLVPVD